MKSSEQTRDRFAATPGAGCAQRIFGADLPRCPLHALAVGFVALVGACAVGTASPAASGAASPQVSSILDQPTAGRPSPTQELAVLLHGHRAFESPDAHSAVRTTVSVSRPITGEQTTLPVIGQRTGKHGVRWLRVLLPGRPNGSAGWITQAGTRAIFTSWRLTVNTGSRRVKAYLRGRLVRTFVAVVGKPSTPTPRGNFFVEETEAMPPTEAGAPFALALSARSNVLQEFAGGPGQIALHGRDNLVGAPGTAASHGCVRLSTPDISWLASRIRPGVRVAITA